MRSIIAAVALSVLMIGCAETPEKVQIVEKKVPVIVVPAPPETIKPTLEVATVTIEKDGYDNWVKAIESDLVRMEAYSDSLEFVINKYRELSKEHPDDRTNNNSNLK